MINTAILLVLVSTIIPYQFAYMIACVVHLATCVRAQWHARETVSSSSPPTPPGLTDQIALHYQLQLLQLRPFNLHAHVMDSSDQRTSPSCVGTQRHGPLVHAFFIFP